MEGKRDEYGLTVKQRKFAENIVDGMNLADAYRNAYDCEKMKPETIRRAAVEVMQNSSVSTAVEKIAGARKGAVEALLISDRDMLLTHLRNWVNADTVPTQAQLRAAELLGKAAGLYRDVVVDERERPAAIVAAELENRLTKLLELQQPSVTVNVVERVNDSPVDDESAASDAAGSGLQ